MEPGTRTNPSNSYDPISDELPICMACGSQFEAKPGTTPDSCKICDDPRQFVPPSGQSWTTMSNIKKHHKNAWKQDELHDDMWSIYTEPKFAIGQRCFLIKTPHGNVLWDMITLLDDATIDFINAKGGLSAIVISHPHYYTTHAHWVASFKCPIHLASDDRSWLCQPPPRSLASLYRFFSGEAPTSTKIIPNVTAIKAGGHFPGSLLLLYATRLFIADTIVTVPSAYTPRPLTTAQKDQISYVFQWSIPNCIPLPPEEIMRVWRSVKPFDFKETHGAFLHMTVRNGDVKKRMLHSAQVQTRGEGWNEGEIFDESM